MEFLEVLMPNVWILRTVHDESVVSEMGSKAAIVAFSSNGAGLD